MRKITNEMRRGFVPYSAWVARVMEGRSVKRPTVADPGRRRATDAVRDAEIIAELMDTTNDGSDMSS
jgi:hypothetical protein